MIIFVINALIALLLYTPYMIMLSNIFVALGIFSQLVSPLKSFNILYCKEVLLSPLRDLIRG